MPPRQQNTPEPARTPAPAHWAIGVGGGLALLAASLISFQTLARLGALIGITPSWLLPIAIDVYAATATVISLVLPARHHARRTAIWNARLALTMSVAANGVYHALVLGRWSAADVVLTFISAWPPVIVERLLHLQGKLAVTGAAPAVPDAGVGSERQQPKSAGSAGRQDAPAAAGGGGGNRTAPTPPAAPATGIAPAPAVAAAKTAPALPAATPPAAAEPAAASTAPATHPATTPAAATGTTPDGTGNVVALNGNGRRSPGDWAQLALPHYRDHLRAHGTAPSAPVLAAALRAAHPDLTVPASERSERNIRSATEALLEQGDTDPERDPQDRQDEREAS